MMYAASELAVVTAQYLKPFTACTTPDLHNNYKTTTTTTTAI